MAKAKSVPAKWIRGPVDRLAIAQGCYFDEDAGLDVIEFVEDFCRQCEGRWAGEPLKLLDWQKDFLMRLFGWKQADGLRRYRTAYLEVAKKNGKSTLVSALCLYLLLADGEGGPQVHINAFDRDQADIVYKAAAKMVQFSEDLSDRLQVIDSKKRIVDPDGGGVIRANSAEVPSKDGANASAIIFDELHRQKTREMWDIFKYAGAARDQPLKISITTAGEDESGVWHEQREKSEQVNAGTRKDITHLGVVYRALPTDNLDDEETWKKANPSLGITIKVEDFRTEYEDAKLNPSDLATFLRLRLNIITRGDQKFLGPGVWEACNAPPDYPCDDEPCWVGIDLSQITDLTAAAKIWGNSFDGWNAEVKFWLPEDNIVELEREHGQPYRMLAEQGWIELTPGNVVDYDWIRKALVADSRRCRFVAIGADPYQATDLLAKLEQHDGLPVKEVRQGFVSLSAPTKELLRFILSKKFRHGDNPILNWHAANAVAERDSVDNIKLSKKKSRLKIDGMAALVNAFVVALDPAEDGGDSVYNERGVLIL